nr:hypothetical protein [Clostridia bacterium]
MKKILSLAIVMATLLALVLVPVNAGRGFSLEAEFGTPVIDGKVDDIWANCKTTAETKYKSNDGSAPLNGDNAVVKVMWDYDNIYFLVEAKDKDLKDAEIFEFYVDEAFDKSTSYNKNDRQSRITVKSCTIGDSTKDVDGNDTSRKELFNSAKMSKTSDGWILEVSLKWAGHVEIDAGKTIGLELMWDTGGEGAFRWNVDTYGTTKDKAPYQSTDNFAPVLLKEEVIEEAPAKAPTAAATFDGLAVLAVVAALSGAGVVVCKRK